jgi:hypothetical protein
MNTESLCELIVHSAVVTSLASAFSLQLRRLPTCTWNQGFLRTNQERRRWDRTVLTIGCNVLSIEWSTAPWEPVVMSQSRSPRNIVPLATRKYIKCAKSQLLLKSKSHICPTVWLALRSVSVWGLLSAEYTPNSCVNRSNKGYVLLAFPLMPKALCNAYTNIKAQS